MISDLKVPERLLARCFGSSNAAIAWFFARFETEKLQFSV
jgi:hypothetical protein